MYTFLEQNIVAMDTASVGSMHKLTQTRILKRLSHLFFQ
jgi:hypothetical protein